MPNERCDADDRVVTPIVRFAELPEMQARGEDRPIDAGRELLRGFARARRFKAADKQ